MKYTKPRGTRDIFGKDAKILSFIERVIEDVFERHHFEKIYSPVFESSQLFERGIGDSSDIVHKEMYVFNDRSNRSLALRPEMTASCIRLLCENKLLHDELPVKVYYNASCYRYERPQVGRFREFRQAGVEILGVSNAYTDIQMILLAAEVFKKLGLGPLQVRINSIGDSSAQQEYKQALKAYIKDLVVHMCPDCQRRYEDNPLRILDCKNELDQLALADAPVIYDYLNQQDKDRLKTVIDFFDNFDNIHLVYDCKLVRGLDYYSQTVFEFYIHDSKLELGALGGGGSYHDLVKQISGKLDLVGSGFSFGLDRLQAVFTSVADLPESCNEIYIAPLSQDGINLTCHLLASLASHEFNIYASPSIKSAKSHIKQALKWGYKFIIFIGDDEIKGQLTIKNLIESSQESVAIYDFNNWLIKNLGEKYAKN